jgi:hypothetical protein
VKHPFFGLFGPALYSYFKNLGRFRPAAVGIHRGEEISRKISGGVSIPLLKLRYRSTTNNKPHHTALPHVVREPSLPQALLKIHQVVRVVKKKNKKIPIFRRMEAFCVNLA